MSETNKEYWEKLRAKIKLNSYLQATGSNYFYMHDPEHADGITAMGHSYITNINGLVHDLAEDSPINKSLVDHMLAQHKTLIEINDGPNPEMQHIAEMLETLQKKMFAECKIPAKYFEDAKPADDSNTSRLALKKAIHALYDRTKVLKGNSQKPTDGRLD